MQLSSTAGERTSEERLMDRGYIDQQLDTVRDKILLLGGATEAAVQRAIQAVTERDSELAEIATETLKSALDAFTSEDAVTSRQVIARDMEIDECYHRVFGELLSLMAENPAATTGAAHLLFVAKHIERIGDYVKDICELNVYLREAVFIKHSVTQ